MYETLKIKLICMVLNGCRYGEWHMFNNWCCDKLTAREYSNIKKLSEYKKLFDHFKEI